MFNKSLLVTLLLIALAWIGYVGFNLVNGSAQSPTPENTFGPNDQVIVVHKTSEIDFNDSLLSALQHQEFIMQLLHEPERVQHFYLSADYTKIVLERSKPWTVELIHSYFDKMALSVAINSNKTLHLSNNWNGQFSDKFLILSSKQINLKPFKSEAWNYVDRKSSYTILNFNGNGAYELANQYRIGDGKSSYFATSNQQEFPRVADQELFQEYMPTNLDQYIFYQKDYGKQNFSKESIAFNWMNYGFALFIKGKDTCFVSDFIPGQDPISSLEEVSGFTKTAENKGSLKGIDIPPFKTKTNLQLEVFNQVVFISKATNFLNEIIGAYETGNTFAQSESLRNQYFQGMPKKVGYRKLTPAYQLTESFLAKTICQIRQSYLSDTPEKEVNQQLYQPLRLDGNLKFLTTIPGSDRVIACTDNNTVFCLNKNKIEWSKTLETNILAKHVVSGNSIFIPTSSGIIGLSMGGQELAGFPIATGEINANLFEYTWKGQSAIAFASSTHFGAISLTGKKLYEFNHSLTKPTDILVIGKKGELIVNLANETGWSIYNVNRRRKVKQFSISEGTWRLNKFNNEISLIGVSKQKLIRINEKNQQSLLIGNCSKLLRVQQYQGGQVYFATQNQTIYIVGENGGLISQFSTTLNNIEDAAIIRLRNGKTIVGLIDGIANNCYIYKENGNEINKENYEGSNRIMFLTQLDGTVVMLSQANGYFVRYSL